MVNDQREGAKAFLETFGQPKKDDKEKEPTNSKGLNQDEAIETEGQETPRPKRGSKRGADSSAASTASTTSKKGKKVLLGPVIDPRKLKLGMESISQIVYE